MAVEAWRGLLVRTQGVGLTAQVLTLREVDEALAQWNERLAAIARNLLELQAQPTYRALTGAGGVARVTVTGGTAARVGQALAATATIYESFDTLHEMVEQAGQLRAGLPALFGGDQKLRELAQLLFGRSLKLTAPDVALDARMLTSGARQAELFTADQLLARMDATFTAARDAVLAVEQARESIALASDRAESRIRALGAGSLEVRDAELRLRGLRDRAEDDPLGALAEFEAAVEPMLEKAERAEAASTQLAHNLQAARERSDQLIQLHADILKAAEEAVVKIAGFVTVAPLSAGRLDSLRDWLARLEHKYSEGALDAVAIGLRRWTAAADDLLVQEQKVLAGNRAPLEKRAELRGRLGALKAKARAYGLAESVAFVALGDAAEAALHARPTSLRQAAEAVGAYEKQLSAAQRQGAQR